MQTYKLLEEDSVLLAQPNLIHKFGRTGATFLNQIHYWLKNTKVGVIHDNQHWIYNTASEWGRQICLSERQIRHYLKKFSQMGIVAIKKLNVKNYDRTNYITINYDALKAYESSHTIIPSHPAVSAGSKVQKPLVLYTKITNKEINNKSKREGDKKIDQSFVDSQSLHQVEQVHDFHLNQDKVIKNEQENRVIKKTTAQDLIKLWNDKFLNSKILLNKDVAKYLVAAFNHKFSKNIMHWKNYLDRLQSSDFIMSKSFVLTLDWALKFKTIDRIFNGDLGVKDILVQVDENIQETNAQTHIDNLLESDSCKKVRRLLIKAIGAVSYNAWFTKVSIIEQNDKIQLITESKFIQDYITTHFGHLFLR